MLLKRSETGLIRELVSILLHQNMQPLLELSHGDHSNEALQYMISL